MKQHSKYIDLGFNNLKYYDQNVVCRTGFDFYATRDKKTNLYDPVSVEDYKMGTAPHMNIFYFSIGFVGYRFFNCADIYYSTEDFIKPVLAKFFPSYRIYSDRLTNIEWWDKELRKKQFYHEGPHEVILEYSNGYCKYGRPSMADALKCNIQEYRRFATNGHGSCTINSRNLQIWIGEKSPNDNKKISILSRYINNQQ